MVNPFETTGSFDRLPYEVLECIAGYLDPIAPSKNIRQFQLLNKRCQSVAEKRLFGSLSLYNQYSAQSVLNFARFLMKPHRCELVKHLLIMGERYMNLNDRFFDEFCNITSVDFSWIGANRRWQYFNETFTPNRCKLKQLPGLFYDFDNIDDEANNYCKAIESHSQTLEFLGFTEITVSLLSKSCNFPRAKKLSFEWVAMAVALQDMDYAISKCPVLEWLKIEPYCELDNPWRRLVPYVPDTQHQQLMRKISVFIECNGFIDMCNYLTAKFANVQEWELISGIVTEEGDEPVLFEKFIDVFRLIMKSARVELKIQTEYSSVSRIYGLLELYEAHTNVAIRQEIFPPGIIEATGNEENLLSIRLSYRQLKSALNATTFIYESVEPRYLELIKRIGHGIQNLTLSLFDYRRNQQENTGGEYILQGDRLVQLLDSCPSLTSFTYSAKALRSVGRISNVASKNLKQLVLKCDIMDPEALVEISHIAPGVVDLTIDSRFSNWTHSDYTKEVLINMPKNCFDRLVLIACHAIQEEDRNVILVRTTSLVSLETKYYIQKYKGKEVKALTNASDKQEYESYSQLSCTRIAVTCQSVKCIECHFYQGRYLSATSI